MKVLCDCWRKSDTCIACYMANLEDWNQIHAIAMSAEAQRRLEDDLRFLESINVWHLVNLQPNPPPPHHNLYGYGDGSLDIITPSTEHGSSFTTNPYHGHPQYHQHHHPPPPHHHHHPANHPGMYLQDNRFLPPPPPPSSIVPNMVDLNNQNNAHPPPRLQSPGYGTSLPYPDLIIHTRELSPPSSEYFSHNKPTLPPQLQENNYLAANLGIGMNGKQFVDEVKKTPPILKKNMNHTTIEPSNNDGDHSPSPMIKNNPLSLPDNSRFKPIPWNPKEPEDYDADDTSTIPPGENDRITPTDDGKKSVKFSQDTVFVERDMDSPFWKAFTERRRQRRINRQRKQLNAQIASASYQPSLVEIVKSAFTRNSPSKDNNGNNCTKRKQSKGEVLVYDNSSQIPETYTAQYVYTAPATTSKRSNKLLQIITCQCCSAGPSSS